MTPLPQPQPSTTTTPPPIPSKHPLTFSQKINTSTHALHTTLNRTILRLLPLALPPHTHHPHLYAHGLIPILSIYTAIESAFAALLAKPPSQRSKTESAVTTLHIPALERAARLRSDLARLLSASGSEKGLASLGGRQARHLAAGSRLRAFLAHIHDAVEREPQLLFAYSHTFYLALFAGGRYIRAQLRACGLREFENDDALSFWTFDWGGEGGEDGLKGEFKRRFELGGAALGERERGEVVRECGWIMEELGGVVEEIARLVGTEEGGGLVLGRRLRVGKWEEWDMWWVLVLKHLLPMGMAELILGGWEWWRRRWREVMGVSEGMVGGIE